MRLFCLTFLLLLSNISLKADEAGTLFEKGNASYTEKRYEEAIESYEAILDKGYSSVDVHYNLGNAYFKNEELGKALLNLERALKLAPDNEDVLRNLRIANLQVSDRIDSGEGLALLRWWNAFLVARSSDGWAWLAITMMWLSFVLFVLYLFGGAKSKRLGFFAGLVFLLVSLVFGGLSYQQMRYAKNQRTGIIMQTNVYVKSEPMTESTDLFILREGTKVAIMRRENEWYQIKLPDGKVGWLSPDELTAI